MAVYAAKFSTHKKVGALQMSPMPAIWQSEPAKDKEGKLIKNDKGEQVLNHKVTREGSLLLEMAPFLKEENDNRYYDWANKKVSFGIGIPDIATILGSAGAEIKLVHVNDASGETKTLVMTPGDADKGYGGSYLLTLTATPKDGEKRQAKVSLTAGEWAVFLTLLRSSVPVMLGWTRTE